MPSDLERLDRAVAALPSTETWVRTQRANWAESRAAEFDAARRDRARQLVGEAIQIEA